LNRETIIYFADGHVQVYRLVDENS